ncbi:helix-turn-helix transcriptional regulator [Stenotrophomonas sp. MH1]|uniref:Helix-turn-helix transcriptional regulator n=1 Tax=Stenotrophomonas capsici TaxID=3110230 RepID=A0ABU5V3W2_9GAMM|nr:helix-turn-helix transcriptional regulator [Stenotrophomonas sp. MH1]MEA5668058.1 helix-turn-helix transcriptional regulator [Stenotrophomonas sp. MH1]
MPQESAHAPQRIAERRNALGLTQTLLAEQLGIAQQTMAHYEGGTLRIAVALLSPLSTTLGMSLEELVGVPTKPGKRGPAPKLQQQLERVAALPKAQQRFVMQMLDTVLQQQSG